MKKKHRKEWDMKFNRNGDARQKRVYMFYAFSLQNKKKKKKSKLGNVQVENQTLDATNDREICNGIVKVMPYSRDICLHSIQN